MDRSPVCVCVFTWSVDVLSAVEHVLGVWAQSPVKSQSAGLFLEVSWPFSSDRNYDVHCCLFPTLLSTVL